MAGPRRSGFTLLEVVLATALAAVLFSIVVLNLTGVGAASEFPEGVRQFATCLRMARAEACTTQRRIRLRFDADEEDASPIEVLWEPDPLEAPGTFVEYASLTWGGQIPTGRVRVIRSELTDPVPAAVGPEGADDEGLDPVTFAPDGSADAAEIELAPVAADDFRRAIVTLDGATGAVKSQVYGESEYQELTER